MRHVVDRIVAPYLVEVLAASARLEPSEPDEPAAAPDRFHGLNHELRTIALERAPKGAQRVVSIGASGPWYFDWFEQSVGVVEEHIGIEAFEPRPPDLPPYVTWIESTADRLDGIDDESIDLVFAGQTTEHLWASELAGFLVEAHRVLRPGAWLVLDSPNGAITQHLAWSHGGHTVELTLDEMEELLVMAGFDVTTRRGIWRCRVGARVLELEEALDDPTVLARRMWAEEAPEDCFIWWVEAQRSERSPDVDGLQTRVAELYRAWWPRRVSRGLWPSDTTSLILARGSSGLVASSEMFPLAPGRWRLQLDLTSASPDEIRGLRVRIVAPGGFPVHTLQPGSGVHEGSSVSWEFAQDELMLALAIEIWCDETLTEVDLAMPIELTPIDDDHLLVCGRAIAGA